MDAVNNHTHLDNDEDAAATTGLHPGVYELLIALALWFAAAVWSFAGGGVTDYLLFIVSGFVFIAVALPLILSRVARTDDVADGNAARHDHHFPSLRNWATGEFDSSTGRQSGIEAAVEILLPIAAAAVGMTLIGIVFHIAEHSI